MTADDIQRVANRYFKPENRAVALYYTKKSEGEEEDPSAVPPVRRRQGPGPAVPGDAGEDDSRSDQGLFRELEEQAIRLLPKRRICAEVIKKLLQDKIQKDGGK